MFFGISLPSDCSKITIHSNVHFVQEFFRHVHVYIPIQCLQICCLCIHILTSSFYVSDKLLYTELHYFAITLAVSWPKSSFFAISPFARSCWYCYLNCIFNGALCVAPPSSANMHRQSTFTYVNHHRITCEWPSNSQPPNAPPSPHPTNGMHAIRHLSC